MKAFEVGEVVLFQRDPGARWELGEFCGLFEPEGHHAWYYVRDDTGFRVRHCVPARRVKRAPRAPV